MGSMNIYTDELKTSAQSLRAGDRVLLSGHVYTARDAAHKRLAGLIREGGALPFPLSGAVIYYAGPTGAPDGMATGSCGPTTSGRMDVYSPLLLDLGLAAMIGKGERSAQVVEAIARNGAVYFCAIGGAGALAAECVVSNELVAFPELGCESIKRFGIRGFPLIVAVDSAGGDLFAEGRAKFSQVGINK